MESLCFCYSSSSPTLKPNQLIPRMTSNSIPKPSLISFDSQKPKFPSTKSSLKPTLSLPFLISLMYPSLPSLASEITSTVEQSSDKINLESILLAIDGFFNKNPFFVSGLTVIWLIVIPLVQNYLSKCKFISAIDGFKKIRDDSSAQLLDIRDEKSVAVLGSPNLRILNKEAVQMRFVDSDEDGFVRRVLEEFKEPQSTVLCVLDNFDGNSMKAAELLFKNGFKEAYAIKGGVRGKKGWQEIQESLLPPSVHMYPKKKAKKSQNLEMNGASSLDASASQN